MKKSATLLVFVLMQIWGYCYTWNPMGTVQMNATKICFGITFSDYVICSDNGMYFYNLVTHQTEFYTNAGLPVKGAAYLDPERIIVVIGGGSNSDGIWTFNLQTHQFSVVQWIINPNFLYFDEFSNTYWVGIQWIGMLRSSDGLNWTEVPFFTNKTCSTMTGYGQHLVVSEISNVISTYWSDDSGETWHTSVNSPIISDMAFSPNGQLYGIFPDYSNSSGLWKSADFGNSWQIEFYYDNLSTVGFDCFGNPFVGWKDGLGLAAYNPTAPPPGLTFLNSGLPNLNINKIQINPTMSAPALFVCTDAGVYFSQDYWLGIDEYQQNMISNSPNPASENLTMKSEIHMKSLKLSTISGKEILTMKIDKNNQRLDVSQLEAGIYLLEIETEGMLCVKKLVVE